MSGGARAGDGSTSTHGWALDSRVHGVASGFTTIGTMTNPLLPARLGEFMRAHTLGRSEVLLVPQAFATIVVEHVFGPASVTSLRPSRLASPGP
jgi:hypothetical protein